MKLRMRGNSLRLRLTRTEVARLAEGRKVTEEIEFPNDSVLIYELESDPDIAEIVGLFENGRISVCVPAEMAKEWAATERVAMEANLSTPAILIEKDFQCMHGEKDPDAYEGLQSVGLR